MRPPLLLAIVVLAAASLAEAETIYQIELRGQAQVFSKDRPAQRGRVLVFHRYPDGLFVSVLEREVVRIEPAAVSEKTETLRPGESIVLGPTGGEASSRAAEPAEGTEAPPAAPSPYGVMNPGYFGYYGYYGGPPRRGPFAPPRGVPAGPPLVGPNGFPILAPPGSPGAAPPVIGPNGFPVLSGTPRRIPFP